jgi:hypothetical protein
MNEQKIYLEKLFPKIGSVNVQNMKIDFESVSYITVPSESEKVSKIACNHIMKYKQPGEAVIIDTTACVGGDTIRLCQSFGQVISIELDQKRYEYLCHNLNQYHITNCVPINGDSTAITPKLQNADMIYVDPPWGGSDYKTKTNLRLNFGDIPLETFIINCFDQQISQNKPSVLLLKIPTNYDLEYLYKTISENLDIYLYKLRKINVLVIERKI